MALNPKFAGHRYVPLSDEAQSKGVPKALHTLEIYLDYVCPFSAKMFLKLDTSIFSLIARNPALAGKVQFIFRQQIQPWHPSSTLTHEAAIAVLRLAPEKFYEFSKVLFDHQKEYFDVNVVHEARNATYARLAKLAGGVGVDSEKVLKMLTIPDKPAEDGSLNVGNEVTNDLKLLIKAARASSVHVSPTVLFNGIEERSIGSSWSEEQWQEWLTKNII